MTQAVSTRDSCLAFHKISLFEFHVNDAKRLVSGNNCHFFGTWSYHQNWSYQTLVLKSRFLHTFRSVDPPLQMLVSPALPLTSLLAPFMNLEFSWHIACFDHWFLVKIDLWLNLLWQSRLALIVFLVLIRVFGACLILVVYVLRRFKRQLAVQNCHSL